MFLLQPLPGASTDAFIPAKCHGLDSVRLIAAILVGIIISLGVTTSCTGGVIGVGELTCAPVVRGAGPLEEEITTSGEASLTGGLPPPHVWLLEEEIAASGEGSLIGGLLLPYA